MDLRNLVTTQITKALEENQKLKFGLWGMVAGPLPINQQKTINKCIAQKNTEDPLDLKKLKIQENLMGTPKAESIPAFIGYIKDGYTYKSDYFFPKSYGSFFVLENQTKKGQS